VYLVHSDLPDPHMQIVHIPLHILQILGVQQVPCIMTWTYISDITKINEQTPLFLHIISRAIEVHITVINDLFARFEVLTMVLMNQVCWEVPL
jgi:hypothetical protein